MFSIKMLRAEHRRPPDVRLSFCLCLVFFSDTWTPTARVSGWSCRQRELYWPNAGTSDALRRDCSPPPTLKKERINLCWALCHLESDTSREAGQEGDQRGALQPGDGHSIRGGDQGWGEIGSRWLAIPRRLIPRHELPQGPAMTIWYW